MNSDYFIKWSNGLLVVGAVCNRDLFGLTYAVNRGYKPLPPTINLSFIIMLADVSYKVLEVRRQTTDDRNLNSEGGMGRSEERFKFHFILMLQTSRDHHLSTSYRMISTHHRATSAARLKQINFFLEPLSFVNCYEQGSTSEYCVIHCDINSQKIIYIWICLIKRGIAKKVDS
jgi:hypothetical protein